MKTLEVRCCCDPNQVLGYLTHPKLQDLGDVCRFSIIDNTVLPVVFVMPGQMSTVNLPTKTVELTVDRVSVGDQVLEAVKNHDYPLEDLQRIPGFSVNKDGRW